MIAVSCGIKLSAVHHLVLSQYTRLTDRQTDRETDERTFRRTDRQNRDSDTVRYITCSRTVETAEQEKNRNSQKSMKSVQLMGVGVYGGKGFFLGKDMF